MCRINIIYAENDNYGILEQNGYEVLEEDARELTAGYTGYVCGWCNCGSFVGTMAECEREYSSLDEMNECETKMKIVRLKEIREFMHQPGYNELKKSYVEKRESLWAERDRLTDDITDYEIEQLEKLEQKYNYEIPAETADAMYQEIDRRYQLVYDTGEYKAIEKEINDLQEENAILEESIMYFLTQEEQDAAMEFTDSEDEWDDDMKELFEGLIDENGIEVLDVEELDSVEFEIPSMVIDDVIERLENSEFTDEKTEFNNYKEIFSQLLETNARIMFTTVWCEAKELRPVKSIKIDELVIEDLAGLKEDDVITIYN